MKKERLIDEHEGTIKETVVVCNATVLTVYNSAQVVEMSSKDNG